MMGTLAKVLAGKKIRTFRGLFEAVVTGDIEDVNGVLKITRIKVTYHLKVPENKRDAAVASLDQYIHLCPAAQSVVDAIDIHHDLVLEEMPG